MVMVGILFPDYCHAISKKYRAVFLSSFQNLETGSLYRLERRFGWRLWHFHPILRAIDGVVVLADLVCSDAGI